MEKKQVWNKSKYGIKGEFMQVHGIPECYRVQIIAGKEGLRSGRN